MFRSRFALPLLLAAVCAAQADPTPAPVKKYAPTISLSFRGGTLAQLVVAIRAAEPKANIIVQDKAAAAVVPAMEIVEAGLDQVLESACAVAAADGLIGCSEQRGNGEPVFAILARSRSRGATTAQATADGDDEDTIVLSLNRLTQADARTGTAGLKVETILSAIEAGTAFGGATPKMRYHQDSGLLFLRGSGGQLRLANNVLTMLERDLGNRVRNALSGARTETPAGTDEKRDR